MTPCTMFFSLEMALPPLDCSSVIDRRSFIKNSGIVSVAGSICCPISSWTMTCRIRWPWPATLQGVASYEANELSVAEEALTPVVSGNPLQLLRNYVFSVIVLSLVYETQGRSDDARHLLESVVTDLLEIGHTAYLPTLRAFEAELALRQGRLAEAIQWVESFEPGPLAAGYNCYVPELTVVKVWLAQATAESLTQAGELLIRLYNFFTSTHNTRFTIEVLALQAMLHDVQGDEPAALKELERALKPAEPGGFIHLFVDLGPKMATLLHRALKHNIAVRYIGQLLTAFKHEELGIHAETVTPQDAHASPSSSPLLIDPLTDREFDILELLAQRLSNSEIAEKLFISPDTVKRHTINIYLKLDVHKRREAVAKAHALGPLSRV